METGLRPNSAGIPYTLLLRIEAMGFPTFGLLLYLDPKKPTLFKDLYKETIIRNPKKVGSFERRVVLGFRLQG